MKKRDDDRVEESSGNVFADLGIPDAEELLVKADLAIEIGQLIEKHLLTQQQAAKVLGVGQPKVSALLRGRLEGFSTDRLMRFIVALGKDVQIVIRGRTRGKRRVTVQKAA